jgi:hypothetical protein
MRAWRRALPCICLATWGALVSLQLGWIPWARHAWGFNLWEYLPEWAALLFAAASLTLCAARVRRGLLAAGAHLSGLTPVRRSGAPAWLGWLVAWGGLALLLWLGRERRLLGDSSILIGHAGSGMQFLFPDVGATFLIGAVVRTGRRLFLLPEGIVAAVQVAVCAAGAFGMLCVWRAARHLAIGHGGSVALLILSGGLLRIFAGHVEVYAFVLAGAGAFLWSSLGFLAGRVGWAVPSLALGVSVWLHPSALALVPSLVFLLRSAPGSRPWRRVALGLALAGLPWLLFLPVALLASHHGELEHAREVCLQLLGLRDDPAVGQRWVRGFGGGPDVGTDYALLGLPHLKYLVNAAQLLGAWVAPVLLLLVARRPARLLSTPTARFLCVASLPLVVYALILRPVWGPFDWDLFSLTALFVASLAAHLLATSLPEVELRHALVWLAGFNLLFVGIPLLLLGFAPLRNAGPFAVEAFDPDMMHPTSPAFAEIAPWL